MSHPAARLVIRALQRRRRAWADHLAGLRHGSVWLSAVASPSTRMARRWMPAGRPADWWDVRGTCVSYLPPGRTQAITDGGRWCRAGRQVTGAAALLPALLPAWHVPHGPAMASFVAAFQAAAVAADYACEEIADGDEITEAYGSDAWEHAVDSCMTGMDVGPWYAAAGARLLVLRRVRTGGIVGRAIVWPAVHLDGGTVTMLDRRYCTGDGEVSSVALEALMLDYARGRGWCSKTHNSSHKHDLTMPDGTVRPNAISCAWVETPEDLTNDSEWTIPYLDTWRFAAADDPRTLYSLASRTRTGDEKACWVWDCTNGEITSPVWQQDCEGNWGDPDDMVDVGGDMYLQDSDSIVECDGCGDWIMRAGSYDVTIGRDSHTLCSDHVTRN